MMLFSFISGPFGCILDILQRQDLHLIRELCRVALLVFSLGATYLFETNWIIGLSLFSCAAVISSSLYLGASLIAIRQNAEKHQL